MVLGIRTNKKSARTDYIREQAAGSREHVELLESVRFFDLGTGWGPASLLVSRKFSLK